MEITALSFPKKSHRKIVSLPEESIELAEFMGALFGDGAIGNPWQVAFSLNSISDIEYADYITKLIACLFSVTAAVRKRPNQNTLLITSTSTTMVDYLVIKGVKRGNKLVGSLDIPKWIKSSVEYKKYFIRGLVDTDGCIYTHKHKVQNKSYVHIGLCFTNFSPNFIKSIVEILNEFGLSGHISDKGRRIYLYGERSVVKYLELIGTSNPRIYQKYYIWRSRLVGP